jgi:hypothetical protein
MPSGILVLEKTFEALFGNVSNYVLPATISTKSLAQNSTFKLKNLDFE